MELSPKQLHILQHSLGVDRYGRGSRYRNHFCTGPESDDFADCRALTEMGLMVDHGPQGMYGGMHGFQVTEQGQRAVTQLSPSPPKLSRSQQRFARYRKVADCFESFRAFLEYEKRERMQRICGNQTYL